MNPRPPSPAYYRTHVLHWDGWADDDAEIRVVEGSQRAPKKVSAKLVEVGAEWCKRNAIPRSALKGKGERT